MKKMSGENDLLHHLELVYGLELVEYPRKIGKKKKLLKEAMIAEVNLRFQIQVEGMLKKELHKFNKVVGNGKNQKKHIQNQAHGKSQQAEEVEKDLGKDLRVEEKDLGKNLVIEEDTKNQQSHVEMTTKEDKIATSNENI